MKIVLIASIGILLALSPLLPGCKQNNGSSTTSGISMQGFGIGTTGPEAFQEVHKVIHGAKPFSIWTADLDEYIKYGPPKIEDRLFMKMNPFRKMANSDAWYRRFKKNQ